VGRFFYKHLICRYNVGRFSENKSSVLRGHRTAGKALATEGWFVKTTVGNHAGLRKTMVG
jgi:hypothetical protein